MLHAGLPVLEGEKWGMNVWIRQRVVQPAAAAGAGDADADDAAAAADDRS